jgi:hypothetical protein
MRRRRARQGSMSGRGRRPYSRPGGIDAPVLLRYTLSTHTLERLDIAPALLVRGTRGNGCERIHRRSRPFIFNPEIQLLGLDELPDSQLDCSTDLVLFELAGFEAPEGVLYSPYEWSGMYEIGSQITDQV